MHTVFTGNPPITQAILSTSSDRKHSVNFTIHKNDYTPLMMSCLTNNIELVRFLLQNGANTSANSSIGKTAAELAAFTGHSEIAALEKIALKDPQFNVELNELVIQANKLNTKNPTQFALKLIEDIFCHIKVRKQAERCDVCFCPNARKQCIACKSVRYCCVECAKLGWFDHKKWCCN